MSPLNILQLYEACTQRLNGCRYAQPPLSPPYVARRLKYPSRCFHPFGEQYSRQAYPSGSFLKFVVQSVMYDWHGGRDITAYIHTEHGVQDLCNVGQESQLICQLISQSQENWGPKILCLNSFSNNSEAYYDLFLLARLHSKNTPFGHSVYVVVQLDPSVINGYGRTKPVFTSYGFVYVVTFYPADRSVHLAFSI
jgi:hypothetical protein